MQWHFIETPIATLTFFITILISHYFLDRFHQKLDHGLYMLKHWIADTWLVLRWIFGAMIWILEMLSKVILLLNTSRAVTSVMPPSREAWMLNPWRVIQERQYHLLLTHGFIHNNYLHLIFNMLVFWFFAFPLEKMLGSLAFFLIYYGSLVIGAFISTYRKRFNQGYRSAGASGALSGVLLAFILYFPGATLLLFFILPMKAWFFALLFLLFSFFAARPERERTLYGGSSRGAFAPLSQQWATVKYKFPLIGTIADNLRQAWLFLKRKSAFIDHEGHFWGAVCGLAIAVLLNPAVLQHFWEQVF